MKIKELLKDELTKKEIEIMPTSFDTVGDIMIFNQFPEELKEKEKSIADKLLSHFKHINVIAKKTGKYTGEYRTPKIKIIGGEKRKETIHKENGIILKLHVEKVYFSVRTSTERKRICEAVKPGEEVMVMFSGIAPLPVVLAKNTCAKKIYGIEINPIAHKYAIKNIKLNKITNVELFCGDVRKKLPELRKKYDRILMPLPKTAEEFLDLAIDYSKSKSIIHLYSFISIKEIPSMKKKIHDIVKSKGRKCRIMNVIKCGQFSPSEYRMTFDIRLI